MITAEQELVNQKEYSEFDALIVAQKARYQQFIEFDVDSALTYKCTETTADSWMDIPE